MHAVVICVFTCISVIERYEERITQTSTVMAMIEVINVAGAPEPHDIVLLDLYSN